MTSETGGNSKAIDARMPARAPDLSFAAVLLFLASVAAVVRLAVITDPDRILTQDEAVFGLMALHIWQGIDFPLFCWEAHYAGALISYVAAPLVGLLGPTDQAMMAATLPLSVGLAVLGGCWGAARHGWRGALIAGSLLAVPVPYFLWLATTASGGFPETFFLGTAVWLLVRRADEEPSAARHRGLLLLACFLAGLGTYILWMMLPFLAAVLAACSASPRREEHLSLLKRRGWIAFLAGLSPLIVHNVLYPLASFRRAAGRTSGTTGLWHSDYWHNAAEGVNELFAPWGIVVALLILGALLVILYRARRDLGARLLLWFFPFYIAFSVVGGFDRARFWAPLYWMLALALPYAPIKGATIVALIGVMANATHPPAANAEEAEQKRWLMAELSARGIEHVLTGYEWSNRISYYTGKRVIGSPAAGPDATDRYPAFTTQVLAAENGALFIPEDQARLWPGAECRSGLCLVEPDERPAEALEKLR